MKKSFMVFVLCTVLVLGGLYYVNGAIGLKQNSSKMTSAELENFHEDIGVFKDSRSNIEISLPTKGVPVSGEWAAFQTYPIVKIGEKIIELKQYKVSYQPSAPFENLRNPFVYTSKGEVLFVNSVYPNELYKITTNGEVLKVNTPLAEISSMASNPIENKIVITGKLPEGSSGIKKYYELDLNTNQLNEIFSYTVTDKSITYGFIPTLSYTNEGILYFDALNEKITNVYSYNGSSVSSVKEEAAQPKISYDGNFLAYLSAESIIPKDFTKPISLEVLDIFTDEVIGSQVSGGFFDWDAQDNMIYLQEQTSLKTLRVSSSGLDLIEDLDVDGQPFIIKTNGHVKIYIQGYETGNPNIVWEKLIK